MIQLKKEECSGCGTCYNICPTECIVMKVDTEGFLYPTIDVNRCIDCGKCEARCPVLNKKEDDEEKPITYAAYNKDDEIRKNSSSGGLFTAIACLILERAGVVFGVSFDQNKQVIHTKVETKEELWKLRGSKYVQSDVGSSYKEAKQILEQDRWVLYTGTACQIAGLYQYLGKDYERLVTQDIICHGTMSPIVLHRYLEYKEHKYKSTVDKISFRDKTYGWKQYGMRLCFANGSSYFGKAKDDSLLRVYSSNICLRPSCHSCSFKQVHREADITLADFWNIQEIDSHIDTERGVSLVLLHSQKGKQIFKDITKEIVYKAEDFDEALKYNMSMIVSAPKHPKREKFMDAILIENDFNKVLEILRDRWLVRAFKKAKQKVFSFKKILK